MKKRNLLIILCLSIFAFTNAQTQQTVAFKEKVYLKHNNSDNSYENFRGLKLLYHAKIANAPTLTFTPTSFSKNRLYVDILQSVDTLYFFPWTIPDTTSGTTVENTAARTYNAETRHNKFFIKIPERTVIAFKMKSWQYGVLTLPFKSYLSSNRGSLNNNFVINANLNAMIGRKFGKRKYYYLPNQKDGQNYERSWSINGIVGIGAVSIDNTNSTIRNTTDKYAIGAISLGTAIGFHYGKLAFYIAGGFDFGVGNWAAQWNYDRQFWTGIGLGLGLN